MWSVVESIQFIEAWEILILILILVFRYLDFNAAFSRKWHDFFTAVITSTSYSFTNTKQEKSKYKIHNTEGVVYDNTK